jgi:dUTP pyrophosphatase
MVSVKLKKLENFDLALPLPSYTSSGAAGADIRASLKNKTELVIKPGARVLVPTGLSFEIPHGFEIQVRPRSGISYKTSLMVLNSPGTIDSDYRGEVKIIIGNLGTTDQVIEHGDRIAQIVIAAVEQCKFEEVNTLSSTTRDIGGFGSTGVN